MKKYYNQYLMPTKKLKFIEIGSAYYYSIVGSYNP